MIQTEYNQYTKTELNAMNDTRLNAMHYFNTRGNYCFLFRFNVNKDKWVEIPFRLDPNTQIAIDNMELLVFVPPTEDGKYPEKAIKNAKHEVTKLGRPACLEKYVERIDNVRNTN